MVSFVYLVIFVYMCEHGPHMWSANAVDPLQAKHNEVERKMCHDLQNICPCDANFLEVQDNEGPFDCATTYPVARFATLPIISPPEYNVIKVRISHSML